MRVWEDQRNPVFGRREVSAEFQAPDGKVTRQDAAKLVAKHFKVEDEKVITVRLSTQVGKSSVKGVFYIYEDPATAKSQLPEHYFLRLLPKDERKKKLEEIRKAKTPAPTKK